MDLRHGTAAAVRIKLAHPAKVTPGLSLASWLHLWPLPSSTLGFSKAGLLVLHLRACSLASLPWHMLFSRLFPLIHPGDYCHSLGPSLLGVATVLGAFPSLAAITFYCNYLFIPTPPVIP